MGGDIYLLNLLIKLLGTALCHVDCPIGRRKCRGVVQREAIVVVSYVYGRQPCVVLCLSQIGILFAICVLLCSMWLGPICGGGILLHRREVGRGIPKLDYRAKTCNWLVPSVYAFEVLAIWRKAVSCYRG